MTDAGDDEDKGLHKDNKSELVSKKIGYVIFSLMGFLFVFFQVTERKLAREGNILWTGGFVWKTLGLSAVLGVLLGGALCFLVYRIAQAGPREGKPASRVWGRISGAIASMGPGKVFLASFCLIALCFLPGYLAYYPGICSYDFSIQLGQVTGAGYNDHHPILHTLLIQFFLWAGRTLWGSATAGIGLFALLQMLALAAVFALGIALLHGFRVKPVWLVLLQLFCMGYPFHWYLSISMAKDVLFTVFFLMLVYALCIFWKKDGKIWVSRVLLVSGVLGVILFRTNGRYALMVLIGVVFLAFLRGRKHRRSLGILLAYCAGAFLVGNLLLSGLFRATGAKQGDRREMLSMPIQQLARCMIYHGGAGVLSQDDHTMSQADRALIQDFLLNEGYKEYRADIADPVKRNTNTYVARYRTKEFLGTYFRLLGQYPGDFINAALTVNAGYLYPEDTSHAWINDNGRDRGLGYVQTRWVEPELNAAGIYKASKWESLYEGMEEWADDNAYLKLPVLKYLFVPGTYLWLYLLLFSCLLVHRRFRMCFPLALILGYYLTLFLGPAVQLRYLYPVMAALPYLALFAGRPGEKLGEGQ